MVLAGFGWFWLTLAGFGWFHVLVTTCQCDGHATSQTTIYANITQSGCIKVYCGWFWVVLAGFVGGRRWFWLVLAGSMF